MLVKLLPLKVYLFMFGTFSCHTNQILKHIKKQSVSLFVCHDRSEIIFSLIYQLYFNHHYVRFAVKVAECKCIYNVILCQG